MKLSDAVLLGSLAGGMRAQNINHCALGVAGTVVGIKQQRRDAITAVRYEAILDRWPWLAANDESYALEIMELFDNQVCKGTMTLEALVEHVRSIEPPCGECCSFDCCCERVSQLEMELLATAASAQPVESA